MITTKQIIKRKKNRKNTHLQHYYNNFRYVHNV